MLFLLWCWRRGVCPSERCKQSFTFIHIFFWPRSLRLTVAPLGPTDLLMKPPTTSLLLVKILFVYLGWFRTWDMKSETHLLICFSLLFVSGYPRTGIMSDMQIFTSEVSSSLYISCLYISTIESPLVLLSKSPKPA